MNHSLDNADNAEILKNNSEVVQTRQVFAEMVTCNYWIIGIFLEVTLRTFSIFHGSQSWGHYCKSVTCYILLVTSMQCNALELHVTPKKIVTSYVLRITLRAATSNIITYYICPVQVIN